MDIIIGYGEIGQAIHGHFDGYIKDKDQRKCYLPEEDKEPIECMHICLPYTDKFKEQVLDYKKEFNPKYIVVHSTVPVGTCKDIGEDIVHSPVIGIHPDLYDAVKTFTKFLGCSNQTVLAEAADHFRRHGLRVYTFDKAETSELMKILCTTNYGLNIEFTKEVKRLCEQYDVPFEAFTIWNNNYNEGYEKMGHQEYHRYNLVPLMKKIGAHCILPNCELLDNAFTKLVKDLNGENKS